MPLLRCTSDRMRAHSSKAAIPLALSSAPGESGTVSKWAETRRGGSLWGEVPLFGTDYVYAVTAAVLEALMPHREAITFQGCGYMLDRRRVVGRVAAAMALTGREVGDFGLDPADVHLTHQGGNLIGVHFGS